jgi:hypothetical protein
LYWTLLTEVVIETQCAANEAHASLIVLVVPAVNTQPEYMTGSRTYKTYTLSNVNIQTEDKLAYFISLLSCFDALV